MAVLVVLSDPRPVEAVRTVLRRVCYLVIPLSIVLIKYFPELGKTFSAWGGQEYTAYRPPRTCWVPYAWSAVSSFSGIPLPTGATKRGTWQARHSCESRIHWYDAMAAEPIAEQHVDHLPDDWMPMIAAAHSKFGQRNSGWIKSLAPVSFVVYLILALGFGMTGQLSQAVGKSANMSDRTHIWEVLLSTPVNPVLGTGYQTFWLGRASGSLAPARWRQRHFGAQRLSSDLILDLGLIGLLLLCVFLFATYRTTCGDSDL